MEETTLADNDYILVLVLNKITFPLRRKVTIWNKLLRGFTQTNVYR